MRKALIVLALVAMVFVSIFSASACEIENRINNHQTETPRAQWHQSVPKREENAKPQEIIEEMEKAYEEIEGAAAAIGEVEFLICSGYDFSFEGLDALLREANEHLVAARNAYDEQNYGAAFGRANSAEMLATNILRRLKEMMENSENFSLLENSFVGCADNADSAIPAQPAVPAQPPTTIPATPATPAVPPQPSASPPPPAPDFSVSVNPTSGEVTQDNSTTATVSVTSSNGYYCWVYLTASSQPSGVTATLSRSGNTPTFTSTLTISADWSTPDTYTITITGTGTDGKVRSATYTLKITSAPPRPLQANMWYLLGKDAGTCFDPWVHSYAMNTSGSVFYNVKFKQIIPPELRVDTSSSGRAWVMRNTASSSSREIISYYPITEFTVGSLGPRDMVYDAIRVVPVGTIDPSKDYSIVTQMTFSLENGDRYVATSKASWREPFSTYWAIGALGAGTVELSYSNTSPSYTYLIGQYRYYSYKYYDSPQLMDISLTQLGPPQTPTLKSPASGESTNCNKPLLVWGAVGDPLVITYELQIAADQNFSSVTLSAGGLNDNQYKAVVGLADGTYYWRVRATNDNGYSDWSSAWHVTIDTTPPPSPELISPENGAVIYDNTPTFEWSSVSDPSGVTSTLWYSTNLSLPTAPKGWSYRKPITINNAGNASPLENYQVKINVTYDSDMKSDFSDLRFTDNDGAPLNYWMESYTASASALVWVKVPFIPEANTKTIYMYYGDPSATSVSDINATLEATYTKRAVLYTWVNRVSTTDVANGDDIGSWQSLPFNFPFWREFKSQVYLCSNGFGIFDPTAPTTAYLNSLSGLTTRGEIAPFWDDLRTDVNGGVTSNAGVYIDSNSENVVVTWETTRYGAGADSIMFQAILWRNGDVRFSINDATNFNNFTPTLGISKGNNTNYIDITAERATSKSWLFLLRKYVSPEPSASVGDEEAPLEVQMVTVPGLSENIYTVPTENALAENTYYWRVRAVDNAGNAGSWSSCRSFTIDTTPPAAPSLVSPAAGENLDNNTPTFNWSDVAETAQYRLQVDNDPDFNSPDLDVAAITTTYVLAVELASKTYYWHVRATDNIGNNSAWSAPRSFNIIAAPLVQENIAIDNIAAVDNNATAENSTVDNSPAVQTTTTDNSTIDNAALQDNVSNSSSTTDNATVQDNTATTNATVGDSSTSSTTTDTTTTSATSDATTTTSDATVSDSPSTTTPDTTTTSTTSDATTTQETTTSSTTTDTTATTDTTSLSSTSEPTTTTDTTTTTSSTEGTTSSATDTSTTQDSVTTATSDATVSDSSTSSTTTQTSTTESTTTDTSSTSGTTSTAALGNSDFGHSHNGGGG